MRNEESKFDRSWEFDAEEETKMDAFLLRLAEMAEAEERKNGLADPMKMRQFIKTYETIQSQLQDADVQVAYSLFEPYRSMGSISIIGRDIAVLSRTWFLEAVKAASNLEIYPKVNGEVCMTFTFHGLTASAE